MIIGDYNLIAIEGEKKGEKFATSRKIREFRSFIMEARLCHLRFIGVKCTWCNKHHVLVRI